MINSPVYKRPDFNNINFIMDKPFVMPHHFFNMMHGFMESIIFDRSRLISILTRNL
jgi:hypothetical protein